MSRPKLTEVVPVRFTPAQVRQINENARLAKISRSTLIRRAAVGLPVRVAPSSALRRELTFHALRVANNVQQLRRVSVSCGRPETTEALAEMAATLRQTIDALHRLVHPERFRGK